MSTLSFRGTVSLATEGYPLAGVIVVATLHEDDDGVRVSSIDAKNALQLGRAETDRDGRFQIDTEPRDARVARWVCALQNCDGFQFRLTLSDRDGSLLHAFEPRAWRADAALTLILRAPHHEPTSADWDELGRGLYDSHTVRLDQAACELTTLAPLGLFRGWTVVRRVALLHRLEQAFLDPHGIFAVAGVALRFAVLTDETQLAALQRQLSQDQHESLIEALPQSINRANAAVNLFASQAYLDTADLRRGDSIAGVNRFLESDFKPGHVFPWIQSPLSGYRDYLRDRWVDNQRIVHKVGGGDVPVAKKTVMYARLKNRLHQDFETTDTKTLPANRLLIPILTNILTSPSGTNYGFGRAPALLPTQGDISDRYYLDSLIALSDQSLAELERRYRINLRRSDLELSNRVQQNIDTLQRFFTDSFQSVDDPFAAAPDRVAGASELLITRFPDEAAGPFFLEFEEWLAREEPFYPENFYDPRATYQWTLLERLQKTREVLFAHSMPVAAFLDSGPGQQDKFVPGGAYDHAASKWQWVRNHIDVWELIVAASNDATSLNFVAAEQKYTTALDWVNRLRSIAAGGDATWQYDPASFAKEQKNADVSTIEKLTDFEHRYWRFFGQHWDSDLGSMASDLLASGGEVSDRWWGKLEDPFNWPGNRRELRYLLDYLQYRYLPACLSEVQLAIGKYADAVRQLIRPAQFTVFAAAPNADVFPVTTVAGGFNHFADGPLPYATASNRTKLSNLAPPTAAPTNSAEIGYFKLKLGNAMLEWADALYRSNQSDSIMRARELYKGVLFLHDQDPEITPTWPRGRFQPLPPLPWVKVKGNPAIKGQVGRARLGFMQINAGLNYYGASPALVPPVRYRVLKEAAGRFVAGARGAQEDFLNYLQQLEPLAKC